MTSLCRVELTKLKSWRSGGKRFVKNVPQYMSEGDAASFKTDRYFKVIKLTKEFEAELIEKGVLKASRPAELPRLNTEIKKDVVEDVRDYPKELRKRPVVKLKSKD